MQTIGQSLQPDGAPRIKPVESGHACKPAAPTAGQRLRANTGLRLSPRFVPASPSCRFDRTCHLSSSVEVAPAVGNRNRLVIRRGKQAATPRLPSP
jgi:hypothetical protein